MTPDPLPTPAERAAQLEVAAKWAADHKDELFEKECKQWAEYWRYVSQQKEAKSK